MVRGRQRTLLAAAVVVTAAVVAFEATARTTAATVTVTEKEFTIKPGPANVKPGKVTFVVRNAGKLEHEFVLLKTNLAPGKLPLKGKTAKEPGRVGKIPPFKPGVTKRLTLNLKAGKYVMLCNVAGHYKSGQRAAFRVG